MIRSFLAMCVCVCVCVCDVSARAQTTSEPPPAPTDPASWVTVELDSGWRLEPVVSRGVIFGFFAQLDPALAVGDNVTLLWLRREATGWTATGWNATHPIGAVQAIREELLDPAAASGITIPTPDWSDTMLTDAIAPPPALAAAPDPNADAYGAEFGTPMVNGFLVTDPLSLLGLDLPPDLAELLVQGGAAGAPGLTGDALEAENPCDPDPLPTDAAAAASRLDRTMDTLILDMSETLATPLDFTPSIINDDAEGPCEGGAGGGTAACLPPWFRTVWGPWSTWNCATVVAAVGGCNYTGCSRFRLGDWQVKGTNCRWFSTGLVTNDSESDPFLFGCPTTPAGACPPVPIPPVSPSTGCR